MYTTLREPATRSAAWLSRSLNCGSKTTSSFIFPHLYTTEQQRAISRLLNPEKAFFASMHGKQRFIFLGLPPPPLNSVPTLSVGKGSLHNPNIYRNAVPSRKPRPQAFGDSRSKSSGWISDSEQSLAGMLRSTQKFHRYFIATLVALAGGSALVLINWDVVKRRMGQEGAEVLKEGIKSEDLQVSAADFSKALLQEMLKDDKLVSVASTWLIQLLKESEPHLIEIVRSLLRSPSVYEEVMVLGQKLVTQLCEVQYVQDKVAELLVSAISTPYARASAATWTVDLLSCKDVHDKLLSLVNETVLNDESVRSEAIKLASYVIAGVLDNPETVLLSQEHISSVFGGDEFQRLAGEAVWNVIKKTVYPGWYRPRKTTEDAPFDYGDVPSLTVPSLNKATNQTDIVSGALA